MTSSEQQRIRVRVVHGWAFRQHSEAEKQAIHHYLDTGEVLEDFPYKQLHQLAEEGGLGR